METATCKPAELVSVVVEQKRALPKTPPQLLLPVVYGLNKSFTKKIYIGLEINQEGQAEIRIRLIGLDYSGIGFSCATWANFVSTFEMIAKYFGSGRNNREMLDQKLVGCGFSVRFIISHMEKAIEIEEDFAGKHRAAKKKYRRSIILKESTFSIMQQYLAIVDARIEHYKKIVESFNFVMGEVVQQSSINYHATKKDRVRTDCIMLGEPDFNEADFQRVVTQLKSDEKLFDISLEEVIIIYNEMLHLRFNANNFCLTVPDDVE